MVKEVESVRIDKWLWSIRIFKTRSLATTACKAGKVKLEGTNIKPSKEIKIGETYQVRIGPMQKVIKVKGLIDKRVGAPLAVTMYDDLTPPEHLEQLQTAFLNPIGKRDRGAGRPTKKDRRDIDKLDD
ncbi:MAG: ribosome-associated heat shock protein Hsp15 [Sphingobacteriales bacterium]|jgi:ribosome-associated heat shock protein Hsp15